MSGVNLTGAVYSFLRVLLVAEASAYLALTTGNDPVTAQALGLAAASALALTLVNYFRPGEPRFGPEPKVDGGDVGSIDVVTALLVVFLVVVTLVVLGVV